MSVLQLILFKLVANVFHLNYFAALFQLLEVIFVWIIFVLFLFFVNNDTLINHKSSGNELVKCCGWRIVRSSREHSVGSCGPPGADLSTPALAVELKSFLYLHSRYASLETDWMAFINKVGWSLATAVSYVSASQAPPEVTPQSVGWRTGSSLM